MRHVISTTCVFVVCAMVLAGSAQAQVLFSHRDDNDPATEGMVDFTLDHGSNSVTTAVNDGGTLAWQWDVGTESSPGYYIAQGAHASSNTDVWTFTVKAHVLNYTADPNYTGDPDGPPDTNSGTHVRVYDGVNQWIFRPKREPNGDQTGGMDTSQSNNVWSEATIPGDKFVTWQMLHDPTTSTVDIFADGTEVLSDVQPSGYGSTGGGLLWGFPAARDDFEDGTIANWAIVEQEIGNHIISSSGPGNVDFEWASAGSSNWNTAGNWNSGGPPGDQSATQSSHHTATFGDAIGSESRTVFTDTAVSVNSISFDNTIGGSYNIAGRPSVNLITSTAGTAPSLSVDAGSHEFQAAFAIHADTTVNIASDSTLTFNNALNLLGNTLTKTGAGTLAINNVLNSGGGAVNLQQGTIIGNGTVGGDVINSSGTISPGNSSQVSGVPEPTAMMLLGSGSLFLLLGCLRRRKS